MQPGESIAFWPVQTAAEKQMVTCVVDTALETVPFLITESHTTLLQLYHDVRAVFRVSLMQFAIHMQNDDRFIVN